MRWRRILISTLTLTGWLLAMMSIPTAWAKPTTPGTANPILLPFDYTDSHGISINQYQLSIGKKWSVTNIVTASVDPGDNATKWLVSMCWDVYRWWVGMAAFTLDYVISMPWVDAITTPVSDFAATLKVDFIDQIGIIPLVMMLLGATVGYRWWRSGTGSAMSELAVGVLVAGLAAAFLTNPVAYVTDGPLHTAQRASIAISNAAMTGTYTDSTNDTTKSQVKAGTMLVDSLIRPVHSSINYGVDIDKHPCKDAYDQALKSPDATDAYTIRPKLGACDRTLADYSEKATADQLFALLAASIPMYQVSITLAVLALVMLLSLAVLLWHALTLIVTSIFGILPGEARASLVEGLAMIATNLIYLITAMTALALGLRAVEGILQSQTLGLGDRFILTTIVFLGIWIGLLALFLAHQVKARKLAKRVLPRHNASQIPAKIRSFAHSAAGYAVGSKISHRRSSAPRPAAPAGGAAGGAVPPRTAFSGGEADPNVTRTLPPPKDAPADTEPSSSERNVFSGSTEGDRDIERTLPRSEPEPAADPDQAPVSPKMAKVQQRLGTALGAASLLATTVATGGTSLAARAGTVAIKARRAHNLASRAANRVHARTHPSAKPTAAPPSKPASTPPSARAQADAADNNAPNPAPTTQPASTPPTPQQTTPTPRPAPTHAKLDTRQPKPQPTPKPHNNDAARERVRANARRDNRTSTPRRIRPPASRPNKKAS